ncbi:phosphopantetheine attachment domain protein [Leptospira ryugenii]|uniref:Phosphopantetheine attachment domain protein n=1 Tax=Leptospira ryugenii TaxID=1917863 RepID=A0A2P2E541_9LEPT|nr:class I adenylate-forming enzyme family protein [Leptospira ryugenii]GBF52005.1 phosphopantetheine attachment domain protein [Leptospira ryugenii]
MPELIFANTDYFLSGAWETALAMGKTSPILIDPKWEGTSLHSQLQTSLHKLPSAEDGHFWMATSGSTGTIKLVEKSLAELRAEVDFWIDASALAWKLSEIDRFFVSVPLCHLYGLLWGYLIPKTLGKPIFLHAFRDPKDGLPSEKSKHDLLVSIPYLIDRNLQEKQNLPQKILSSGAKFPVPLAKRIREMGHYSVQEIYGSTETGAMGVRDPLFEARFYLLASVEPKSKWIDGQSILQVKSPFISKRAFKDSGDHWIAESLLDENGFYETGDAGELNEDQWNLHGRVDRIIKRKGKRVSLDHIENLIQSLDHEMKEIFCASKSVGGEDRVYCFYVGGKMKGSFLETMQAELPKSLLPDEIIEMESLPKLPNGKTDNRALLKSLP